MRNLARSLLQLYRDSLSGLPRKVWMLAIVLLVNRSGAMVVAFLSVYLVNGQGFSLTKSGYVMAAFGAGGIVGNYVGGLLNDKYGSWHLMLYSTIGAGFLNILLGQFSQFWALCLLSFLVSLVADSFRPANRAAIATYTPKEKLTQAYGLQRIAVNLGLAIGPAVGGILAFYYGYKLLFWADGLTYLLSALVFVLLLPKDETARPLGAVVTASGPDEAVIDTRPGWRQPWLLALAFGNTAVMLCFFQFFSTLPVYLVSEGYDERAIGYLLTVNGFLIFLVEMPLVYTAERRYRTVPVMLVGGILILIGYLLLPSLMSAYALLLIWILFITIGEILYMPFTNSYVAKWAPPARRGEYLGILSASYSMAFVTTPVICFRAAEHFSFEFSIYLACGLGLLGVLLVSQVNRLRKLYLRPDASVRPQPF